MFLKVFLGRLALLQFFFSSNSQLQFFFFFIDFSLNFFLAFSFCLKIML